jgi:hypothetical protein
MQYMSNQETALVGAKAQHTGQEHKSYLCPKPLTGGIKQLTRRWAKMSIQLQFIHPQLSHKKL